MPAALPRVPEARVACEAQLGTWATELGAGHELAWVPVPEQVDLQSEAVLAAFRLLTE